MDLQNCEIHPNHPFGDAPGTPRDRLTAEPRIRTGLPRVWLTLGVAGLKPLGFEAGSGHLTVQDSKLMPEDEDLGILGTVPGGRAAPAARSRDGQDGRSGRLADPRSGQITPIIRARNPRSTCLDEFPAPTRS
jgi:hypothetical protein